VKLVYFHGFGSSGNSDKSQALKDKFGEDNVWSPDLPIDATEVIHMVTEYVHSVKDYPIIFMGTSLGGFYANYFAQKFDCPCILINPAINPGQSLTRALGENKNYASGLTFELTQQHLDKWTVMADSILDDVNGALINLFVALDDEVIDAEKMIAAFPYYHYQKTFETGGHRFSAHWPEVVDFVETLL
jgi:predicted esterase YcpF (UPF0227 family)